MRSIGSVGGYLYFHGNAELGGVQLNALTEVGAPGGDPWDPKYIYVRSHPMLTTFHIPALTTVRGSVNIGANPLLCLPPLPWASISSSVQSLAPTCGP